MGRTPAAPAAITQSSPQEYVLSGAWTAQGIGAVTPQLDALTTPAGQELVVDGARIEALDTAGAWVLQKFLHRLEDDAKGVRLRALRPEFGRLLEAIRQQMADQGRTLAVPAIASTTPLERLGRHFEAPLQQGFALLSFVGECALALGGCIAQPTRLRWRPILYNIRSAGFDALPIVGMLSFLLGVVVAYQGAGQLRQYGANIFVADLVGLSILREFAPLITAIIVAGRSGSAYAAQIGTMSVTEEIDAMRTLGIAPLDLLVLPKLLALLIALPLLTVFADALGVFGGMIMARAQLGVGFGDFLDRFVKAISVTAYLLGVGKAPVFAAIIAVVGCFQGFRTRGGADSVGRQTTRAVVQSIFLVIVADALFSVAFSALDL
ncbi:MlaE family lipid ABC transporter permease subunit [Aromatoleum toluclasticum]|uniref:ABC transporter permease n=1 Tax=Aromatoleum toluclasticum TaxID=92003 RepID=UPI001D17E0AB|nr:MlaE family lipid ABC transporter permease subunit [Aromatoleum toluclasticum]MCC4117185.1 MlaE family lipid ABC transporter permease subunit [Aromatoleum toluclasticum]